MSKKLNISDWEKTSCSLFYFYENNIRIVMVLLKVHLIFVYWQYGVLLNYGNILPFTMIIFFIIFEI